MRTERYAAFQSGSTLLRPHLDLRTALLIAFIGLHLIVAISRPYGAYDALAMWNLKARYISTYADPTLVFQLDFMHHNDYPPLVPVIIGAGFRVFGFTQAVPIAFHALIYAALLFVFRRAPLWALAIVAVATLEHSTWQFVDLLIALCFVAAWKWYQKAGDHIGVGAWIGVALMSKNEGVMLASVMLAVLVVTERRIPWRVLIGVVPGAVALLLFKTVVSTAPNDVVSSTGIAERLLDPSRYVQILEYGIATLWRWQLRAIPIFTLVWAMNRHPIDVKPLLFVALSALGFLFIYVITPHDLSWHLESSADRLVLQLFPTFALALVSSRKLTQASP